MNIKKILIGGLFAAIFVLFSVLPAKVYADSYVFVSNLQPSWTGGVYSAYYGANNADPISPGTTAVYLDRQAAPIYAGLAADTDGHYRDQGLLAFKPGDVPIEKFAEQPLRYDFVNQYGTNPVWMYIELNKGITGDVIYQYVPISNPTSWHTEHAASGKYWQQWTNVSDGITTGPMLTLEDIAKNNPGATVSRVYLTEGMGDAYHAGPNGTYAWVDWVTIGDTTYNFVVGGMTPTSLKQCENDGYLRFTNPTFASLKECYEYVNSQTVLPGTASGSIRMASPSQRIEFEVNDGTNSNKGRVEYWNYGYPGGLHYNAKPLCVYVDKSTKESRFMFQIPDGFPGLSGLYVVVYVKDGGTPGKEVDLYGHNATADLATAQSWCNTGSGFSPTMYPITVGNLTVQ